MNYNKLGKILIIQSTYDNNNAFDKDGDAALISIFKNFKFDLQLEFTQDIWEIFDIISEIEDKSIVHLIIKAHGMSNHICIGPNNNKLKSNSNILLALCNLIKQKITSECSILLHSCLVGAEPTDKDSDNVATFFAQCLPGHIIFGAEQSIKRGDLLATELLPDYDNNVLLVDYEIDMDANYNMYKFIKRKDNIKKNLNVNQELYLFLKDNVTNKKDDLDKLYEKMDNLGAENVEHLKVLVEEDLDDLKQIEKIKLLRAIEILKGNLKSDYDYNKSYLEIVTDFEKKLGYKKPAIKPDLEGRIERIIYFLGVNVPEDLDMRDKLLLLDYYINKYLDIMKKIDKKKKKDEIIKKKKKTDIDIKEDLYNVLLPYMNKENQLGVAGIDGVTYKAEINGKNYAIKTFKKKKSTKKIEKEVEYQRLAADAGISPKVLNVNLKKKYIVMELMNELLIDYMKRKGLKKLEKEIQFQLVACMEILDNIGILHNDGNIRNIMLDNNNEIKIIDFGFSKLIKKADKRIRSVKSPNGYLTLRMLKRSLKYNGFETGDIIDKFISTSGNKI